MILYNSDSKLYDVVINDPSVITVINRFNIFLGLGDKTVREFCELKKIDKNFFLTILNTYINEDYFPEEILKSFSISRIIGYLEKTNNYYQEFQLPNIERHFDHLIMKSGSNDNNLSLLRKFFNELKQELISRIESDNKWFPYLIKLDNIIKENDNKGEVPPSYDEISNENNLIEDILNDLKNFFIIHLHGTYDQNLCYAVINAIYTLEKDIKQNNRIRDRILMPIAESLKDSYSERV